jgi:hypothetical protein
MHGNKGTAPVGIGTDLARPVWAEALQWPIQTKKSGTRRSGRKKPRKSIQLVETQQETHQEVQA